MLYFSDDLVDVFPGLPREPFRELLVHLNTVASDSVGDAELRARFAREDEVVTPESILERFESIFVDAPAGHPLSWYCHRALHRVSAALLPTPKRADLEAIKAAEPYLTQLAAEPPRSFLYTDLILADEDARVFKHIDAVCDLEGVAFLGRSRQATPRRVPADLRVKALEIALREGLGKSYLTEAGGHRVWPSENEMLSEALLWLEVAARNGSDLLSALGRLDGVVPARLEEARTITTAVPFEGKYLVDRKVLTAVEVESRANVEYDAISGGQRIRVEGVVLYDLAIAVFDGSDSTLDLLVATANKHPELAGDLADRLGEFRAASVAARRRAAQTSPDFFEVVVRLGWKDVIAGNASFVEMANNIADVDLRLEALLAIGPPAVKALESLVDEDLAVPCDPGTVHYRVMRAIDESPDLGLPFWIKRVGRPGFLGIACEHARLRAAWRLDAAPMLRLIKRHGVDPDAAACAVVTLLEVNPDALHGLDSRAHGALRHERLSLITKVHALLMMGTEESREMATALAYRIPRYEHLLQICASTDLWSLFERIGQIDGNDVVKWMLEHGDSLRPRSTFCRAAANAALGALTPEQTSALFAMDPYQLEVLAAAADDAQLAAAAAKLDGAGINIEMVRARKEYSGDAPPSWLEALSDNDLGVLHVAVGKWVSGLLAKGPLRFDATDVLRRSLVARCRAALGSNADAVLQILGDRWPTRRALHEAAVEAGVTLSDGVLGRCADEGLPSLFRTAMDRLLGGERPGVALARPTNGWDIVRWALRGPWPQEPELAARHLVPFLAPEVPEHWARAVALALVALRESSGTDVPDALTRMIHAAKNDEQREFYLRQRNAFSREHTARERDRPPEERTASALLRLERAGGGR